MPREALHCCALCKVTFTGGFLGRLVWNSYPFDLNTLQQFALADAGGAGAWGARRVAVGQVREAAGLPACWGLL